MSKFLDENGVLYLLKAMAGWLGGYVKKEEGKGLSSNDYTAAEKAKLAGITGMTGATSAAAGKTGLVPAPAAGAQTKYLRGDGTWSTPPNTTYSDMKAATADAAGTHGLVPAPAAGAQAKFLRGDGTWQTPANTTYAAMTGATASAAGKTGLVPAPAAGKQTSFLRGDGTWVIPANTTYSAATQTANGLMTAADKKKLDSFGAASTYATTSYVAQQIAAAGHIKKSIVSALPAAASADANTIYMVAKSTAADGNGYNEYMVVDGKFELIGDTQVQITALTNAEIDAILDSVTV